jgi:hypothetical protein
MLEMSKEEVFHIKTPRLEGKVLHKEVLVIFILNIKHAPVSLCYNNFIYCLRKGNKINLK